MEQTVDKFLEDGNNLKENSGRFLGVPGEIAERIMKKTCERNSGEIPSWSLENLYKHFWSSFRSIFHGSLKKFSENPLVEFLKVPLTGILKES